MWRGKTYRGRGRERERAGDGIVWSEMEGSVCVCVCGVKLMNVVAGAIVVVEE